MLDQLPAGIIGKDIAGIKKNRHGSLIEIIKKSWRKSRKMEDFYRNFSGNFWRNI